jgi:hypothetical protein
MKEYSWKMPGIGPRPISSTGPSIQGARQYIRPILIRAGITYIINGVFAPESGHEIFITSRSERKLMSVSIRRPDLPDH